MPRSWLLDAFRRPVQAPPADRAVEVTIDQQLIATGAAGSYSTDPLDGDRGFKPVGSGPQGSRPVPTWTLESARQQSVMAYRANPMGRAIIETYVAFCVGDVGVRPNSSDPDVQRVLDDFWADPRVNLGAQQELWLRSHLLYGESLVEAMVGEMFGNVRLRPIDVTAVQGVQLLDANPMWPDQIIVVPASGQPTAYPVIAWDDLSESHKGQVFWRADWQSVVSDVRGLPFLTASLDWLAGYDRTLWNLVDTTSLRRYFTWDVTVEGSQEEIDRYKDDRGGANPPESGSIEFHNSGVTWKPMYAPVGSEEDAATAQQVLTNVSAGVGLAKTWLSEPEGSNRATSVTMAEPVRRRVSSVQKSWLSFMTEICQYVVDQAVAVGKLPRYVNVKDSAGGTQAVQPWRTVTVIGPEIAGADAAINATIMSNLAAALVSLSTNGMLPINAAEEAAKKAWQDYTGRPWEPGLDDPDATAAWKKEWMTAPPAPVPPGAQPGVNNQIGSGGPTNSPSPPGDATARSGAPS